MNGIIFCVCLTLAISVLQIVLKSKSHSKIEADDEFGLPMQRKDSWRAAFHCIRKPGENQTRKSISSEPANWAALQNGETRSENAYSSSYSEWNVDKTWSSQEWKSDELMEDRTGRPLVTAQHTDRFIVQNQKCR